MNTQFPFHVILEYEPKDQLFLADWLVVKSFTKNEWGNRIEFVSNNEEAVIYLVMSLQHKVRLLEPEHICMEVLKRIEEIRNHYHL